MLITPLHFEVIPLTIRAVRLLMSNWGFVSAKVDADIPAVNNVVEKNNHTLGNPEILGTLHGVFTQNFAGLACWALKYRDQHEQRQIALSHLTQGKAP